MNDLMVIRPLARGKSGSSRLSRVLDRALAQLTEEQRQRAVTVTKAEECPSMCNKRILFAIDQEYSGINLELYGFMERMRLAPDCLSGSVGSILVDGSSELYTKSAARELALAANLAGCAFPGKPMVEGTASLENFSILAQQYQTDLEEAYCRSAAELLERLLTFEPVKKEKPQILAIHASNHETSNTIQLWNMVKERLEPDCVISEISVRNGEVQDCTGCPFTMCLHFSEKGSCFYGGVMVEQVYPALLEADGLMMLCPNYNDAVSANLSAFINRLTALFRQVRFYEKSLFALVVSGYSGGDLVAEQLIGALNMNKTFALPARFAMLETANKPDSILRAPGIRQRAADYGDWIKKTLIREEATIHER